MPTKFEYGYSKSLRDPHWKQLVNVGIAPVYSLSGSNDKGTQNKFLKLMEDNYGKLDQRYNIRWTDYGVDVRFKLYSDAASFIMLHTCKKEDDNFRNYPPRIVGH